MVSIEQHDAHESQRSPAGTRREPALNRVTTRAVRSTSNLVLPYPQVVSSDPHGLAAVTRLHIGLLWSCGALTRPVHYRGLLVAR